MYVPNICVNPRLIKLMQLSCPSYDGCVSFLREGLSSRPISYLGLIYCMKPNDSLGRLYHVPRARRNYTSTESLERKLAKQNLWPNLAIPQLTDPTRTADQFLSLSVKGLSGRIVISFGVGTTQSAVAVAYLPQDDRFMSRAPLIPLADLSYMV